MSDTKFLYFDIYARGEAIRMLAHHCKIHFVDERLTFDQFREKKAAGFFINGQVPVWIENGKQYNQSYAILRMLGARNGLYSNEPEKMWEMDAATATAEDWIAKIYPNFTSVEK